MDKNTNGKKVCFFCKNNIPEIDYKNADLLRKYINPQYKILNKRRSGNCSKHQRMVAEAIKKARIMALLPFTPR